MGHSGSIDEFIFQAVTHCGQWWTQLNTSQSDSLSKETDTGTLTDSVSIRSHDEARRTFGLSHVESREAEKYSLAGRENDKLLSLQPLEDLSGPDVLLLMSS